MRRADGPSARLASSRMNIRLVFLPDHADGSAPSLTFDEEGRVIARAVLRSDAENPPSVTRDVIVVPGVDVVVHGVALPMRSERQARAAVAILLEDQMASSADAVHLALGPMVTEGKRGVAVVSQERMKAWLDQAARLGVQPAAVVPTYALLPELQDGVVAVATILPTELSLRGRGIAAAVEPELLAALVGERPTCRIDDAAEREQMLAMGAAAPAFDLLQGAFAPNAGRPSGPRDFRRAAVLAALLLVSPFFLWGAQIARDRWAVADNDRQAQILADRLAPGADQSLTPAQRLRWQETRSEGGERFIRALSGLFTIVEQAPGASMVSLYYGAGGQARATIAHANYSDVDAMKQQASRMGFDLREDSTATENGRVISDLVLEARR